MHRVVPAPCRVTGPVAGLPRRRPEDARTSGTLACVLDPITRRRVAAVSLFWTAVTFLLLLLLNVYMGLFELWALGFWLLLFLPTAPATFRWLGVFGDGTPGKSSAEGDAS